ncbi:MAG: hypothetical protein GXO59_02565, partial [Dictyoglomi bacterium]|nr:hypothetical protein [Dictyoglomota bacterium]
MTKKQFVAVFIIIGLLLTGLPILGGVSAQEATRVSSIVFLDGHLGYVYGSGGYATLLINGHVYKGVYGETDYGYGFRLNLCDDLSYGARGTIDLLLGDGVSAYRWVEVDRNGNVVVSVQKNATLLEKLEATNGNSGQPTVLSADTDNKNWIFFLKNHTANLGPYPMVKESPYGPLRQGYRIKDNLMPMGTMTGLISIKGGDDVGVYAQGRAVRFFPFISLAGEKSLVRVGFGTVIGKDNLLQMAYEGLWKSYISRYSSYRNMSLLDFQKAFYIEMSDIRISDLRNIVFSIDKPYNSVDNYSEIVNWLLDKKEDSNLFNPAHARWHLTDIFLVVASSGSVFIPSNYPYLLVGSVFLSKAISVLGNVVDKVVSWEYQGKTTARVKVDTEYPFKVYDMGFVVREIPSQMAGADKLPNDPSLCSGEIIQPASV